jgi:hypothetical protein
MSLDRLPAVLLRLEGAAVLAASVALYADGGWSWLAYLLLFLAPDLSMLAYVAGQRAGTVAYDLVHFAALPIGLGVAGVVSDSGLPVQLALVWLGHIGIDRALGYGLKYPSAFRDSHMQRV